MPDIDGNLDYSKKGPRRKKQKSAPPRNADTGDRARSRPAPARQPTFTPKNPAPAFRPISSQVGRPTGAAKPFRVPRSRLHHAENKAASRIPSNSKLPRIPVKTGPAAGGKGTRTQAIRALSRKNYRKGELTSIYKRLRKARGNQSAREFYMSSNMEERRYLRALGAALEKQETADANERIRGVELRARARGYGEVHGPDVPLQVRLKALRDRAGDSRLTDAERIVAKNTAKSVEFRLKGGSNKPQPGETSKLAGLYPDDVLTGLGRSAVALAEGTARDPVGVPTKTIKQAALSVKALPSGIVNTVVHPVETAKAAVKDYAERNNESYDEKLARIRKEGGFQDAADLLSAASFGSGAAARTAFVARAPARATKLLSGGAERATGKRGVVSYGLGRFDDKRRAAALERKAEKGTPLTGLELEALRRNRAAGEVVAVVPRFSSPRIRRHGVAKPRGRGVAGLRYDRNKGPLAGLAKERFNLNDDELKALWPAMEAGIHTPEAARQHLPTIIAKMEEGRKADPKGWEQDMDVIAQLKEVAADPERYFTPNLRESLGRIKKFTDEISDLDPQFKTATKEARRRAVQEWLLGLEKGVIDEPGGKEWRYVPGAGRRVEAEVDNIIDSDLASPPSGRPVRGLLEAAPEPSHDLPEVRVETPETSKELAHIAEDIRDHEGYFEEVDGPPPLRYRDESDEDYLRRIDAEAAKAGLAEPMYFKSEKHRGLQQDFGAAVVGGGRAKSTGRQFKGENLDKGIFDTTFAAMLRGYEHNVKARHNYDLVESLNRHNVLKSLTPEPQGVTLSEALNRMNQSEPRLNRESVTLVNPGLFKRNMPDDVADDMDVGEALDVYDEGLQQALSKSVVDGATKADPELLKTPGWYAWPTEAARELHRELNASTAGGRAWDIGKGATSKAILMTGNTPWLGLQFAQEFAATALVTKGRALTPKNIAGTVKWWRSMNDRQKSQVAAAMGMGATAADFSAPKMGSSVNRGFAHTWRAFKNKDFWHRPRVKGQPINHIVNPVHWMRAADMSKTNMTRLLAAHSELTKMKPESIDAISDSLLELRETGKAIDRVLPVFDKPAAEQLKILSDHPEILEHVGETLNNALGDWSTLTASERVIANRAVMFYPFVRYSARLLFYTLPVEHPAITALLGELGALTVAEYRETFGNDDLPWNLGKVYWGKDGHVKSIDLNRANPLMSGMLQTITAQNVGQAVGTFPPFVQWAFDQAYAKSSFRDRPWIVEGDPSSPYNRRRGSDYGFEERARIAGASAASLLYPYRTAMDLLHPEAQGDDSLLFDARPIDYKSPAEITGGGLANDIRREKARNSLANQQMKAEGVSIPGVVFGPLMPRPSRDLESSQSRRRVAALEAEQEKRRKEPGRYTPKKIKGLKRSGGGRSRKRSLKRS